MSRESNAYEAGRDYGWNEAVEQIRQLRYENQDNPRAVQVLTDLLDGLLQEEVE